MEKIALGLGNNVDYEVQWDSGVIEDLIRKYRIGNDEIDAEIPPKDIRSLVISILGYIRSSHGGERFVLNPRVIEDFSALFSYKVTVGGTAPRAAIAMSLLGYPARLHLVTNNEHVRCIVPKDSRCFFSCGQDSIYPHLIIQYTQGTEINAGGIHILAEGANRIIYNHDMDNITLKLNPAFFDAMADVQVLLISGFNAMHDQDLFLERLKELSGFLERLPPGLTVFFEDACYYNHCFTDVVQRVLSKYFHIYSLNEDELGAYTGKKIDLLNSRQVYSAIQKLKEKIPSPVLVVHTKYWALAYANCAEKYRKSLQGGICMATAWFRFGDAVTPDKYQQTADLGYDSKGVYFCEEIQNLGTGLICCEPSLAVTETKVTSIGLGDAFVGGFLPTLLV